MKQNYVVFQKYLNEFTSKFLEPNFYIKQSSTFEEDTLATEFVSFKFKTELDVNLCEFKDGRWYFQVTMHKDEEGEFGDDKFFALSSYFDENENQSFKDICMPGEDFENFANVFFSNLKNAFETFLHDNFTGNFVIEHDWSGGYK